MNQTVFVSIPTHSEIVASARAIVERLRGNASESDRLRHLSDDSFQALQEAGLLQILVPRRCGGYEGQLTTVLEAALAAVRQGDVPALGASVLGYAPTERDLRFGLETTYRARARHAPDAAGRIALIDHANRVRPRTLT